MNLVSLFISAGISLIYTPFTENSRNERNVAYFPFSVLRNTSACETATLTLGENQLKVTTIPRGYCKNCCPTKISRDIRFVLYTKSNSQNGIPIFPMHETGAAKRAGVNPNWETVIFIHGFSEPSPGQSGREFVDAYLSRPENYNVILLDWSELSSVPWYRTAVQNVKLVGRVLVKFIKIFNQSGEIPTRKLHIIGFSLGSHIASMAGKRLQEIRIPRITALDPAFPEFSLQDSSKRLEKRDADYVDVIHTDSGIFGFPLSIGHADFYPNGGRALQPGCQPSFLAQQKLSDQVLACSHVRAWRLYVESVKNPEAFPATQCQNWRGTKKECNFTIDSFMGFRNNKSTGQFYLRTGFQAPFGLSFEQQTN